MHTDVHRFGRRDILALATTCKLYAVGLYDEVRCAQRSNALVRWPLCGAVVYLKRTIRVRDGLVNGAPLLVLYVSGDFAETLTLSPLGKRTLLACAMLRSKQSMCMYHRYPFQGELAMYLDLYL